MKLRRTPQALSGFRKVSSYILQSFGIQALREFRRRVHESEEAIVKMPNIGAIEWTDEEGVIYRSLTIHRRSKLLYFIKGEYIFIADFWDTRHTVPTDLRNE